MTGKNEAKSAGSETELVNRIDEVKLEGTGTPPVHYLIKVRGSVLRENYKNPTLIIKSTTPEQGNLTYFFAADPPIGGGPGTPVSIEASRHLYELDHVRKITVVGATNSVTRDL